MRWIFSCWLVLAPAPCWAEDGRPRVSSGFGVRSDPLHGRRAAHRGIDLPGRHRTPVLAAAAGRVSTAARRGGYGQLIELRHADGSVTRYAHLSRILVRPGEIVAQGQPIGAMGSTGRSTGTHLHFEYRLGGRAVDPMPYLRAESRLPHSIRPVAAEAAPHRSRFAQASDAHPESAGLPGGRDALRALSR